MADAELSRWDESDAATLRAALSEHRKAVRRAGELSASHLAKTLGVVAAAARIHTGLRAHPNQLLGAIGLWHGALVEMATGEGKTLTLAMAAMLRGWQGRPCHVVTANDYLARRDAQGLARFYESGGLRAGWVVAQQPGPERRKGYEADICYTTAKELLADWLRDRLALGPWAVARRRALGKMQSGSISDAATVMRGVYCVLVDEADHVLIDEAVTPLIISQPRPNAEMSSAYVETAEFARKISSEEYRALVAHQDIELGESLRLKVREEWQPKAAVLKNPRWREELVRQALRAREFFQRDKQYIIKDDKVVIIDESTGRPQAQRSWRQGLHQMVEAAEGVALTDPADTMASISFQRFFRQVPELAGVSGTAAEERGEFWRVYGLPVIAVDSHRPNQRRAHSLQVVARATDRWRQVVDRVAALHVSGRPMLVGTRSVAASETLAKLLGEREIPCAVLNARQLEREADVVAGAGQSGCVTIATNLAGRGTDIQLGEGVVELGGLVVIATEMHASRRVDRQLFGRCARQGDPGETWAWASLEDELAERNLYGWWRRSVLTLAVTRMPGAGLLAKGTMHWVQRCSARRSARQRHQLARQDQRLALYLGDGSVEE